jgi:hypothetical protein
MSRRTDAWSAGRSPPSRRPCANPRVDNAAWSENQLASCYSAPAASSRPRASSPRPPRPALTALSAPRVPGPPDNHTRARGRRLLLGMRALPTSHTPVRVARQGRPRTRVAPRGRRETLRCVRVGAHVHPHPAARADGRLRLASATCRAPRSAAIKTRRRHPEPPCHSNKQHTISS